MKQVAATVQSRSEGKASAPGSKELRAERLISQAHQRAALLMKASHALQRQLLPTMFGVEGRVAIVAVVVRVETVWEALEATYRPYDVAPTDR
ncbi:MAG TPA: hypothetical protein VMV09_01665 [Candidatus Saccharimonadales bacterium]|nr:hypothetical protein [Candidatus Saccharimonadales bacterium]